MMPARPTRDLALPLLIGLATLTFSQLFQTVQLVRERATLATVFADQANPTAEAERVRAQLESVLGGANTLAQKGNAAAAAVMADLARQGITYRSTKPAP